MDINRVSKEELIKLEGIGEHLAEEIIKARPFRDINDLLRVPGIGKKMLKRLLLQGATVSGTKLDAERLSDLSILERPISHFMKRDCPTIAAGSTVAEAYGVLEESGKKLLVVVDREKRVVGVTTEKHLSKRCGGAGETLRFLPLEPSSPVLVSPDLDVVEAARRLMKENYEYLIVVSGDRIFQGVVQLEDLKQVEETVFYNMCYSKSVTSDSGKKRKPPENPQVKQGCECSLLIFVAEDKLGWLIDWWTGGYGYSHVAIDCCEFDPKTGESIIIEAVKDGVVRTYLSSYGSRPYVRIPLKPYNVDCEEFCRCVKSHLGEPYDYEEAVLGVDRDPNRQICSGLAFDCLPEELQKRILADKRQREGSSTGGEGARDDSGRHRPHPRISPNDLARFFGAPKAADLVSGQVVEPSRARPGDCIVRVTLMEVRYGGDDIGDDWKYEVSVQGRTKSFAERTVTQRRPDRIGQEVFSGPIGVCDSRVQVYISVTAIEVDPIWDDVGSNSKTFEVECPGQRVAELEVNVSETYYGTAKMTFVFNIEARCSHRR